MSTKCDICKCDSYERTNGESELDNVKEAKYSCGECRTQYCEECYKGHDEWCNPFCEYPE